MEIIKLTRNELCPNKTGKQRSLTTNSSIKEVIELDYRQGASGKPVKSPEFIPNLLRECFIPTDKVLNGIGKR